METYALFYNTDKVKEAPKTMEDFVAKAKEVGFQLGLNSGLYYSYAFLSGYGGYLFKNNNGTTDVNDIGLNNSGAVKGYQLLQDFVVKYKFMNSDTTGDGAKSEFQAKNIGLYISGPWDVKSFEDVKVPFAMPPLPTIEGKPCPSFVGVQAAFVSQNSKNQTEAWDLMKYINEKSFSIVYKAGNRLPVPNSDLERQEFKDDKYAVQFANQAKNGEPMPNVPEIQAVWKPAQDNLSLLYANKIDAKTAADNTVKQIKENIEQQK